MANKETYSAKHITALSPRNHLIKRINLTFSQELGDESYPFSSQKSVAIREYLDNSVGELIRKFGDRMRIHFYKDGAISVQDNGRGLPTDTTKNAYGEEVSGFIITLGTLQSGEQLGKSDDDSKTTSTNGLGAAASTMLSKRVDITVYKNKKKYTLSFKDGDPGYFDGDDVNSNFTELKDLTYIKEEKDDRPADEKKLFAQGTTVKSWLNNEVFSSPYPVDVDDLILRMKGVAFLLPGVTIEIVNEHRVMEDGSYQHEVFHFEEGIPQLVEYNQKGTPITPIYKFETKGSYVEKNVATQDPKTKKMVSKDVERTADIELAFGYDNDYEYSIDSYVNTIRTRLGGVHVEAFEEAITTAFNEKLSSMKGMLTAKDPVPTIDDYKEGLTAVLSLYISEPQYTSQIKEELGGRVVKRAIKQALYEAIKDFVEDKKNVDVVKRIGEKVIAAAKARQSRKEQLELKREKQKLTSNTSLPNKLVDCEYVYEADSELIIVEGDSALSGVKEARDSRFQALLPIRGKIVNTSKENIKKVLANQEVQDIAKCLNAGIGEDFDLDSARYQRVIIAADADPDGGQIASLLVLLFYNLFPDLIRQGRLYKMNTPLYIYREGKGKKAIDHYAFNDTDATEIANDLKSRNKSYQLIRVKGLGEAGSDALRATGLDPETRVLTQITIGDEESAKHWLDVAMGKDVAPRKKWIEDNPIDYVED